MIRARAAFLACRFDDNPHGGDTQDLPAQTQVRLWHARRALDL
jgi:hypothetical protein